MYAFVEGKLDSIHPALAVVNVNGVGYALHISLNTFSTIQAKQQVRLLTYLHVREDIISLYGFADEIERDVFLQLISVSGVGTNTARMILSSLSSNELRNAILLNDVKTIQAIKGIGPKTAQRIIIDLKDKITKLTGEGVKNILEQPSNKIQNEALFALQALGFNKNDAEKVLTKIINESGMPESIEILIKKALKNL
jgi:Holliday junction DNA helicase RuvA